MTLALEEARRAADRGEVPVGAVLTRGEVVLAHGGNAQIELHDATAHAETRVLREAGVLNVRAVVAARTKGIADSKQASE